MKTERMNPLVLRHYEAAVALCLVLSAKDPEQKPYTVDTGDKHFFRIIRGPWATWVYVGRGSGLCYLEGPDYRREKNAIGSVLKSHEELAARIVPSAETIAVVRAVFA